jgi:hypothetical protein
MIRDAALPRTVIIQNVTEPKPALLHELPRSDSFQVGWYDRSAGRDSLAQGPQPFRDGSWRS